MERFTFNRAYYESLKNCSPETRIEIYDAICVFCFDGNEPSLKDPVAIVIWNLIRPALMIARKQSLNGSKGGAQMGNTNACKSSKKNAQNKPKTSQKQAKNKQDSSQIAEEVPDEKFQNFNKWIKENAPYCANQNNLNQLTQKEFHKLKDRYTSTQIMEVILDLENRKDKRKTYVSLYRTLIKWLKNNYG